MLFIGVIAVATIAFTQGVDIIRGPMINSLAYYKYNGPVYEKFKSLSVNENTEVTEAWDSIQEEVSFALRFNRRLINLFNVCLKCFLWQAKIIFGN